MIKYLSILYLLVSFCVTAQEFNYKIVCNDCPDTDSVLFKKKIPSKIEFNRYINNVLSDFNEEGFLVSSLDSVTTDSIKIIAYLYKGPKILWGKIKKGNSEQDMLSEIGYRDKIYAEKPLNNKRLIDLKNKIVTYYENKGYPFSRVQLDSVFLEENHVNAVLKVSKGEFVEFDSLKIEGTAKVSYSYLSNYLGIKYGSAFNQKIISQLPEITSQIPFLKLVKPPELKYVDGKIVTILYLEEKKASQFYGVLGVMPDNKTGEILFTGDMKLKLVNALKRGELLDLNWRRIQKNTQDLSVALNHPFVFNTMFGADTYFKLYRRDTLFNNIDAKFGVQYMFGKGNYITGFVQNNQSSLISTNYAKNIVTNILPFTATYYGLGVKKQKLDYFLNPRKGYSVETELSTGNKTIKKTGVTNTIDTLSNKKNIQFKGGVKASCFVPIRKTSVVKFSFLGGYVFGENLLKNELYRIGGLNTLRGFNEESIFASSYSIASLEYRYMLEQNSYLYLFFDGAYLEQKNINQYTYDVPYGFGAGLSFETKAGIFTISYALGQQQNNPLEIRSAKVHFGFVFL